MSVHMTLILLKAGMPLYHITYRNTPNMRIETKEEKYNQVLSQLPENAILDDRTHPKYFGLTPQFPYYYGADGHDRPSVKYITSTPLVLLDAGFLDVDTKIMIDAFNTHGLHKCIDGWLAYDDCDNWRELYIFHPDKHLNPVMEPYVLKMKRPTRYEWEDDELSLLNTYLIGCFDTLVSPDTHTITFVKNSCEHSHVLKRFKDARKTHPYKEPMYGPLNPKFYE